MLTLSIANTYEHGNRMKQHGNNLDQKWNKQEENYTIHQGNNIETNFIETACNVNKYHDNDNVMLRALKYFNPL